MKDSYRYIAQITIEAATPLSIGSGESHLVTDSPVCTDANGIPMIPGTSLCGVLRHSLEEFASFEINKVFGFQDKHQPENSEGSRIIVSSAHPL